MNAEFTEIRLWSNLENDTMGHVVEVTDAGEDDPDNVEVLSKHIESILYIICGIEKWCIFHSTNTGIL